MATVYFILTISSASARLEAGYALLLDAASTSHVLVTNAPALNFTTQATFEAWVMPNTLKCNTIVSRGDGSSANTDFIFQVGFNGAVCGTEMRLAFFGSQAWHVSSSTIPLFQWSHVAATYDGAQVRLYINGALDRTLPRAGSLLKSTDQAFYIGRQGSQCACNFFDGQIDELRIWNVVRSPSEIATGYLQTLTGTEPGLAAYWKFNEADNALPPLDSTGHSFNGSLRGGARYVFSEAPLARMPDAFAAPATNISARSATLKAFLDAGGWPMTVFFQYGPTPAYGFSTTAQTNVGFNAASVTFTQAITGLQPGATVHYRVVAQTVAGTSIGNDASFVLRGPLPSALTEPADAVTGNSARLNGTINPNGATTTAYFEFGTTLGYGLTTTGVNVGDGDGSAPVSHTVTGLEPGFTYHFRAVGSNSFGVVQGDDMTFALYATGPSVITLLAQNIGATRATLQALVSPNGAPTQVRFDYGTTSDYGLSVVAANNLQGASGTTVSQVVTGLLPGSQIYWRAVVSNPSGSGNANGAPFRTLSATTNALPPANAYTLRVSEIRPAVVSGFKADGQLQFFVRDGGAGYVAQPEVTLVLQRGTGGGATATATIVNGVVTTVTLAQPGTYSDDVLLTAILTPPNPIETVLTNSANINVKTIVLVSGRFEMNTVITRDITIEGQGVGLTTLAGGRRGSVLRVQPGVTVTLRGLTITQGEAPSGGGIYNDVGHLSIYDCDIVDNRATGQQAEGGGIYNRGNATMLLDHCSVRNNFSARTGGGISSSGINTQLPGVLDPRAILDRFVNRLEDAAAFGVDMVNDFRGVHPTLTSIPGALEKAVRAVANAVGSDPLDPALLVQKALARNADGGNSILANSANDVRTNNVSGAITSMPNPFDPGISLPVSPQPLEGRATASPTSPAGVRIANSGWAGLHAPILVLNHCTVTGNRVEPRTSGMGGGIHADLGLVVITDTIISGNSVNSVLASFGGGISTIFGAVSVVNSTLTANQVKSTTVLAGGAAINSFASALNVQNSTFAANSAQALFLSSGGAIKNTFLGTATVNNTILIGNSSGGGGALANDYGASLSMDSCTIASNSVSGIISAFGGGIRRDRQYSHLRK